MPSELKGRHMSSISAPELAASYLTLLHKVIEIYEKARIPSTKLKTITEINLYFQDNSYRKCQKISIKERPSKAEIKSFNKQLKKTMPFPPISEQIIRDNVR